MLRIIFTTIAILLLLPLLFMGAVLSKAHWDIRQVTPNIPDAAQLQQSLISNEGPVRISYIENASQTVPDRGDSGHVAFVLEWADGRFFLIDTGMDESSAAEFSEFSQAAFGALPLQFKATVADQMGSDLPRVQGIAFTHLHSDHVDGMGALCEQLKRPVTVFQSRWQMEYGNFMTDMGRDALAAASCAQPQALSELGINTIPGFPGLLAISLGGHTPGSTLYAVNIDGVSWLLSGDISNEKAALLANEPKPLWYSTLLVPEASGRLDQLRRWLAGLDALPEYHVVVSHDLGALRESGMPVWGGGSQ